MKNMGVGQVSANQLLVGSDVTKIPTGMMGTHTVEKAEENIVIPSGSSSTTRKSLLERFMRKASSEEIARMGSENYGKFRESLVSIGQTFLHFLEDGSSVSNKENKTLLERFMRKASPEEIARMGSEV